MDRRATGRENEVYVHMNGKFANVIKSQQANITKMKEDFLKFESPEATYGYGGYTNQAGTFF